MRFFQQSAGKSPSQKGSRHRAEAGSLQGTGQRQSSGGTLQLGSAYRLPRIKIILVGADRAVPVSRPNVGLETQGRYICEQGSMVLLRLVV